MKLKMLFLIGFLSIFVGCSQSGSVGSGNETTVQRWSCKIKMTPIRNTENTYNCGLSIKPLDREGPSLETSFEFNAVQPVEREFSLSNAAYSASIELKPDKRHHRCDFNITLAHSASPLESFSGTVILWKDLSGADIFPLEDLGKSPAALRTVEPQIPSGMIPSGAVYVTTFEIIIAKDGTVEASRILKTNTQNMDYNSMLFLALRQWLFSAPVDIDGNSVSCFFNVTFTNGKATAERASAAEATR